MELDLQQIFKSAFGYDAAPMTFHLERKEMSNLGQRYYGTDLLGREHFLPVRLNNYLLPFAVIGMTCRKNIVSTPMPMRGGSIHELISIEDYQFNIKGIVLTEDNSFPESQIKDVYKLFEKNASLELRSVLTDIVLNGAYNHSVVITEIKWPTVTGVEHAKPFEMELEGDMAFTLEESS